MYDEVGKDGRESQWDSFVQFVMGIHERCPESWNDAADPRGVFHLSQNRTGLVACLQITAGPVPLTGNVTGTPPPGQPLKMW